MTENKEQKRKEHILSYNGHWYEKHDIYDWSINDQYPWNGYCTSGIDGVYTYIFKIKM